MEFIHLLMYVILNLTITLTAPIRYTDNKIRMLLENNVFYEKVFDINQGES